MLNSGWQCIVLFCTVLSIVKASGLYQVTDNITIFNANNIVPTVSNSSTLWLIEYYLEWCGHCQHFAPIYKDLASNVKDWFPILQLGAINCADSTNSKFCTKQNVTAVPDMRLYSPASNLVNGDGSIFTSQLKVKFLRENLIREIENNIDTVQWRYDWPKPNFQSPPISFVMNVISKKKPVSVSYLAFVFEKNSTVVGKEIILDMSSCSNIIVRRITSDSSDGAALQKQLRLFRDVPFIVVVARNGTLFDLDPSIKSRSGFVKQLRALSGVGEIKNNLQLASSIISVPASKISVDYRLVKRDRVYLADLESGLRYMFTIEVSSHKVLSGDKLESLKMMLKLLSEVGSFFPVRPSTTMFFKNLYEWIKSQSHVLSSDWLEKIEEKQENNELPKTNKLWVGCLGSAAKLRGYPCSLWTIFHALSVALFRANLDESLLPAAMHSYITNFFGCLECRNNFKKEISDLPFYQSESPYDAILWLWKMHNKVNKRLHSTSSSEDPAFPKIRFPPQSLCPRCWTKESQGELRPRSGEIARFLIRRFSPEHVSWEYLDVDEKHPVDAQDVHNSLNSVRKRISNLAREDHGVFRIGRQQHNIDFPSGLAPLNQLDFNLCMLVWFVSAVTVLGLLIVFHTRGRWLKQIKSSRHVL